MAMDADEREAQAEGKGDKAKTKAAFYRNQREKAEETGDTKTLYSIAKKGVKLAKGAGGDPERGNKAILATAPFIGAPEAKAAGAAVKGIRSMVPEAETIGSKVAGAAKSFLGRFGNKAGKAAEETKPSMTRKAAQSIRRDARRDPVAQTAKTSAKGTKAASRDTAKVNKSVKPVQKGPKTLKDNEAGPMKPTMSRREARQIRRDGHGHNPAYNTRDKGVLKRDSSAISKNFNSPTAKSARMTKTVGSGEEAIRNKLSPKKAVKTAKAEKKPVKKMTLEEMIAESSGKSKD